jgi:hypothetical protein
LNTFGKSDIDTLYMDNLWLEKQDDEFWGGNLGSDNSAKDG